MPRCGSLSSNSTFRGSKEKNWSKTVHCSRRQGGEQITKIAKIEQEQNWGRENRGEIAMEERAAASSRGEIYRSRRFRESFEVTRP
jgi:hypothetical protein